MSTYTTSQIRKAAKERGVTTTTLGEMMEEFSFPRVSPRVLKEISRVYEGEGLKMSPSVEEMMKSNRVSKRDSVRVFPYNSIVDKLTSAVSNPSKEGDEFLLQTAGSSAVESAQSVIEDIKNLF